MPTILRLGPYRFYFYSAEDGERPHVHIDRDLSSAKLWLDPVEVGASEGFPRHELRRLRALVEAHHDALVRAWDDFHGS
ncbi:MAG: DUF4160 domain-containing protein [Gemmatimonadota bacterium]